jgi:two-component system OmpR family sensor kinase
LQAAFDRQRRFIADASHELRTPLTIMRLELGRVLGSGRPPEKYQHALQVVSAESERMTRLVQDLMTLARMDTGEATMQWESLDLGEVAVEAAERLSGLAARRQVTLDIGQMPRLHVRGDRQYLVLMISNLVENAIKYGGPSSIVKIQAQMVRDVDRKVGVLLVSDNGPGIPAEHLPALFDRFYRVDAARTADGDDDDLAASGSGLGLSIVAGIVQLHGGQVDVTSQPGQGTTFKLKLPLA